MFDWEALPDCCQPSDGADSAGTDADRGQDGGVDAAAPATTVAATAVAEQAEVVSPSAVHRPDVGLWWRVVHTGPVNVRKKPSLQSRILGSKKPDAEVRGQAEEGWLRLLDEEGFMRISADFCPFLMRATACVGDFKWVGASNIFDQLEQELAGARSDLPHKDRIVPPLPPLPPRPVPTLAPPPRGRRAPAETAGGGDGDAEGAAGGSGPDDAEEEEPHITVNLAQGTQEGAEEVMTEVTRHWLVRAREWLKRLDPQATVPPSARLPQSALNWEPAAAVLFVLTHGHFDPRRDVPAPKQVAGTATEARGDPGLVSVCCATSDQRRSFHPLIYESFRRQTHAQRELVVVHTGEQPSEFFLERAREDPRVLYRFFPVSREAPGSPRLSDEKVGSPWHAVMVDDDPAELTYWEHGDPWTYEIRREGWTKGLKRNVACCIASGAVIVHFDDGCLYAPDYVGRMRGELLGRGGEAAATTTTTPMGAALSKWYTVGISDLDFRFIDMRVPEPMWELYGQNSMRAQEKDSYNHGFTYVYTRAAWELQPFPDVETVGTKDSDFLKEALAACGWHRDATCGSKDVPANINDSMVLDFLRFRGREARQPLVFSELVRMVTDIGTDLLNRRERYLQDLVADHGAVHVCAYCNFAVALTRNIKQSDRTIATRMQVTDGYEMTKTFAKDPMNFDVVEIARAGGAVAEGHWAPVPDGHPWLRDVYQRMAICRNCGFQLGWRYETGGAPKECASPCCTLQARPGREYCCPKCRYQGPHHHDSDCEKKDALIPKAPVVWGFIWRHLRERRKPNEQIPEDDASRSRHKETNLNFKTNTVCPKGHKLRRFCTGQGNGGALPFYYICDLCDRTARGSEHLWGCGSCDYDMCERCRARR
mmetsp:Transcript_91240/g.294966  ORF Transcript_91240/g.294966 Transcript_91240/m.294966 type:complete len:879 (-) Transcript_91240:158-2794(-)